MSQLGKTLHVLAVGLWNFPMAYQMGMIASADEPSKPPSPVEAPFTRDKPRSRPRKARGTGRNGRLHGGNVRFLVIHAPVRRGNVRG